MGFATGNGALRPPFRNQHVVVLGGTSGIGFAAARAAHDAGAAVTVVSSNAERVAQATRQLGERASGHAVDLLDEVAVQQLFDGIGAFDHLVYSAGDALPVGPLSQMPIETLRRAFELRVFGAIAAVKHGARGLLPGGSVVLTSGIASERPQKGWIALAGICAAMEGMTRALAVDLAPLRVNIVSPGYVRTPMWSGLPEADRDAVFASVAASLPVGRIGEADEVGQTFLYLMRNGYTTGQVVVVDGGLTVAA